MAAILGLDDDSVRRVCDEIVTTGGGVVEPVNFNAPGQVVIAGHLHAVNTAVESLKAAGARRAMPLPVSAPFHTSLMNPAAEKLAEVLATVSIKTPEIPVVHNVHARTEGNPDKIRTLLVRQTASPVLWTDCVATLHAAGATRLAECGPGNVLCGLNRRINKTIDSFPLESPEGVQDLLTSSQANRGKEHE